ncbi:hypothetical protein [Algicola sagamiensis]|uniref:hypothetical protein n=1 Tax=Algicola sagamiensis TaxID=163869 RepID=UPI00037D9A65|nr:hypothetical protein [Algicola sagamiensis]
MTNTISSNQYQLKDFFDIAASSDNRVIAKEGQVKVASTMDKGAVISSMCNLVDGKSTDAFLNENLKTGEELGAALRHEFGQWGARASTLIQSKTETGTPITQRDIADIKKLLPQLMNNHERFENLSRLLNEVAKDDRFIETLREVAPGEIEGGAEGLGKYYLNSWVQSIRRASSDSDPMVQQLASNNNLANAKLISKAAASLLVIPGIVFAMKNIANVTDKEASHGAILSVTGDQNSKYSNDIASIISNALYSGHDVDATYQAVHLTTYTAALPLSQVLPFSGLGVAPAVNEAIAQQTSNIALQNSYGVSLSGTRFGGAFLSGVAASETNRQHTIRQDLDVMPKMLVGYKEHEQVFDLQTNERVVRALLLYLGPAENRNMSHEDAPVIEQHFERTRMALKKEFGSLPSEDLKQHVKSPKEGLRKNDKALIESLSYGAMHNPNLGNIQVHSQLKEDLTRDLSKEQVTKNMLPKDVRAIERSELLQGYPQEDGSLGAPSVLRMLYAAEGWLG